MKKRMTALLMAMMLALLATVILGTLLHFTYQWSGRNPVIGIFSAVSESTWE